MNLSDLEESHARTSYHPGVGLVDNEVGVGGKAGEDRKDEPSTVQWMMMELKISFRPHYAIDGL